MGNKEMSQISPAGGLDFLKLDPAVLGKVYKVVVYQGSGYNLHIHDLERKTIYSVWMADQYALFRNLVEYVRTHGVMGQKRVFGEIYHFWAISLTAEQIVSLLYITKRNINSSALCKLSKFLNG